ncbi:MAG: ATP phosphoribosyltransferase regulatory subunit [Coprococcus sp.]|nr:ATP phosphoribosyltransferase regulatory subunit [Coprococcus sp.]
MKQLLHTPEGVRDLYHKECAQKLALTDQLHQVLHLYGYHDIQTPTFEFFDVFRREIGTIPSRELYKFFDKEGNTLVLRPDMTPQIARAAATLFSKEDFPARLCYIGDTFINHSSYQGRLKESTQLGAEFLGSDSVEADAEMLALVVDCLKQAGLERFQITAGNVDFFQSLIEEAKIEEEAEARLRELITNRNYFGMEELLKEEKTAPKAKEAFLALPRLIGDREVLDTARTVAPCEKAAQAIERLCVTYDLLKTYKMQDYVSFDLSMSGIYGYYTGIIFRAYTFGSGDAIVKGGRYNHLIEKFGSPMPSIGFAVVVDDLMSALQRQKIPIPFHQENTLVVYDAQSREEAIRLAMELRRSGRNTELFRKDTENSVEDYIRYGKNHQADSMVWLEQGQKVRMVNLITGEHKTAE